MSADARTLAPLAAALFVVSVASPGVAALCGDASGDGFFKTSDALQTLKLAVGSGYDRRADLVAPFGTVSASDALASLKAVVQGRIPSCAGAQPTRLAVTTAAYDFSSGGLAIVDLESGDLDFRPNAVGGDAVVRIQAGRPVVVNRDTYNSLQTYDVDSPSLPTVKQCSVSGGFNSNPQDVVFVSETKGYVTPYAGDELFVIDPRVALEPQNDPSCSGLITDRIDLSSLDPDGVPEMDQMVAIDGELFVSLQLLDFPDPVRGGAIAVIDTTSDTVTGSIPLSLANPFAATKGLVHDEFLARIFVGGPGIIGEDLADGGIEAVDPVSKTSLGLLVSGADLGGVDVFDFVIVGTRRAFAIVADTESNSVVELDLARREQRGVLLASTALITDIEMTETGRLWVAYRGEKLSDPPRLRVFDLASGEESPTENVADAVPLPQAPFTLAPF